MFEYVLFAICVVGPVLWFFALPLLVYQTHRMSATPEFNQVDNPADLPEPVRRFFFNVFESLTSTGFIFEGTFYMPQLLDNVRAFVNLYVNRVDGSQALAVAAYLKVGTDWRLQATFIEIETRFADETSINTSNQTMLPPYPKPPGSLLTIHPRILDPAVLYQAHQSVVKSQSRSRRRIVPLDEQYQGDSATMLSNDVIAELTYATETGHMQYQMGSFKAAPNSASPYSPPSESAGGDKYRPTLKGAYLLTWKEIFPLKSILLWFRTRKDDKILAEAGFRY